ncbi:MAG: hypothetical protein A3D95_10095 [Betaproteobacteria bacterium RIFCSPHIGHO2_12_FULL_69_13]|nr:MAG: hypothetical protein A3D95_10095 [Betaproteobacteria bacterium RIFCSPHIGHO2_12_FULL_69_13]
MTLRLPDRASWFLLWCLLGAGAVQLYLAGPLQPAPSGFSAIFWYLLKSLDPASNVLLLVLAVVAFALRDRPGWQPVLRFAGSRPLAVATAVFVLLSLGALLAYRGRPLSMDEYSAVFQAKAFAAGRLSGELPVELLDRLVPRGFQGLFITVSRATGEAASTYWPTFSLLLAPFERFGASWALNPVLGSLSLLAIHRLAKRVSGSQEAGAWAMLFTLASPAFVVNAMSYYAMTAHLLANAVFALLLVDATPRRALAAGFVGALALTLHNPLPHLLFAVPFIVWLAARGGSLRLLACLAVGYLSVGLPVGLGWKMFLKALASADSGAAQAIVPSQGAAAGIVKLAADQLAIFAPPTLQVLQARIYGLTKLWTWAAAGLVVLALWGYWLTRHRTEVRVLALALVATFVGYLFIRFDQGHGWGFRYLHSAWFVLPLLAALALTAMPRDKLPGSNAGLHGMAGWCLVLSLVLANALRIFQVDTFVRAHLGQVPPLASGEAARVPSVVFVDASRGFYAYDLVQNHPLLRESPVVMLGRDSDGLMARHFPGYVRVASGQWGEHWVKK